ncbi:hypothetical protein [Dethiosulfovibrio salsuginis]|uniref:Uncharacterized protein n=1 Tax=Dethiosulfovibrio salsuginis TaxID=561720 RepID=A0A1X7JJ73_9BACT|nr:hypothetical protein [Dethiosulfovibrio salsuginis]SMG27808.1 hypothetical protein SAMN06275492_11265 [Dethiosulfovibrio salsuginis]
MKDIKVLFPIFLKDEGDGSEIIPLPCAGMGLTGIRLDLKEQPDGRIELYDPSHESWVGERNK